MLNSEIIKNQTNTDPGSVWKACLNKIKGNVTLMTYNTWFLPIKPIGLDESTLRVQLPSKFFWEWIDEHYNSLINKTINDVIGPGAKLSYIITEEVVESGLAERGNVEKLGNGTLNAKPKPRQNFESYLNSRYTFDNFIKGEGNQLARAAAGAISDNPGGTSFNPFFVYGGVGLGKTHLIQAVGNEILKSHPNKKVIYLSSDIFTVEFVEAIQSNKVN